MLRDEHGAVLRNTGQLRVRPADGALVDAAGRVHPRRFAIGPHTTVRVAGAFTRPGMNAQSLRYNDAVARAVLRALAARLGSRRGRLKASRRSHDGESRFPRRRVAILTTASLGFRDGES